MIFYGIADAHGLESFTPAAFKGEWEGFEIDPQELKILALRANANRHRHAIVYWAEVPLEVAEEVLDLLKQGEYAEALLALKAGVTEIRLMRTPGGEKSWRLIPNPDLDPYHE